MGISYLLKLAASYQGSLANVCFLISTFFFSFFHCLTIVSPSLLSHSKANELLQSSKQIQNKLEKERTLRESLRLYQQISQHNDLPLVCAQYRQGKHRK